MQGPAFYHSGGAPAMAATVGAKRYVAQPTGNL
jgi:hypothetical protein